MKLMVRAAARRALMAWSSSSASGSSTGSDGSCGDCHAPWLDCVGCAVWGCRQATRATPSTAMHTAPTLFRSVMRSSYLVVARLVLLHWPAEPGR